MDNFVVSCDSDYTVNHDYAYVMLKSGNEDSTKVIFSHKKLDTKEIIELMRKYKADIGCDLFFTNKKHRGWMPIEFYCGILWTMQITKRE